MHGFAKVGPRQPPTKALQQGSRWLTPQPKAKRGEMTKHPSITQCHAMTPIRAGLAFFCEEADEVLEPIAELHVRRRSVSGIAGQDCPIQEG
jgi:hypothetical protein